MPRVAPITSKADVAEEHYPIVDDVLKVFERIGGPYSVFLQSPKLAGRVLGLGNYFRLGETMVAARDRSLAILVAARQREGAYVWAAQVNAARRAGVREEAIDLIRRKGDPAELLPEEREIVTYARQLMETNRVEQSSFDALKNRHGVPWLVELTAATCYYSFLSGVVSAFEVDVPPGGDELPE